MQMSMKTRNASMPNAALISILLLVPALSALGQSQWPTAGQNLNNSRSQPAEHSISPANVKNLSPKWVFTTTNDVSATPTVVGDTVYFPDWGGNLYAVTRRVGASSGLTRSLITTASADLSLVLALPWMWTMIS
jgi:glucose dehydrogenase